jgi:poly(3-hydroxybutyrate) depolymerase
VDVARKNGFLLVVPEGSGLPKGWFASNRVPFVVDDVQFVRTVLDQLAEDFCIDEQRVYARGCRMGRSWLRCWAAS